jgi:hypothetical protein
VLAKVRTVNQLPPLSAALLAENLQTDLKREQLPPYWALFARSQLRWTTVGILSGVCARTAAFFDPRIAAEGARRSGCRRRL